MAKIGQYWALLRKIYDGEILMCFCVLIAESAMPHDSPTSATSALGLHPVR